MQRKLHKHREDEGVGIVDFVMTVPALFLLVLIVAQIALWQHARHVALASAQEGARVGAASDSSAGIAKARATTFLSNAAPTLITAPAVTVARDATTVTVDVRGNITTLVPGLNFSVHETSSAPVERFVAR